MSGTSLRQALRSDEAREAGELLARHESGDGVDLEQFAEHEDDAVAFASDVLDQTLTPDQRRALELLAEHDRVAWQAAQAVGKSRTIAVAALWWAYSRRGQVVISAPTARTVQEVITRKELARLWRPRPELKGELYTNSLRIRGDEPSVLAYTATSAAGATGQHDPEGGVLAILDEAQGVPPEVWVAMDANTTGARDRQFVCGNPTQPSGDFYEVCQEGSGWATIQTSALDHPNLDPESDLEIPGGPSRSWLERMRDRWGEDSPQWQARVLGRFPSSAVDSLFEVEWLDTARTDDRREELEEPAQFEPVVLGVDPARQGPDATAVAIRQGPILRDVVTWHEDSLEDSADRVEALVGELTGRRKPRVKEIVVDSIGIGAGLADSLRRRLEGRTFPHQKTTLEYGAIYRRQEGGKIQVRDFNSGSTAGDTERFDNLRAQAFWELRDRLEAGEFALPDDTELREELLAMRWEVTPSGKVKLPRKEQLKSRLGRSPDRADSLAMSFLPDLDVGGPEFWFA